MIGLSIYSNRRGISPIIAVLLLMVIAVAAAIVFYLWSIAYMGEITRESDTTALGSMVKIEGIKLEYSTLIVFVRNTGDTRVRVDKLFIEKNGVVIYALDVEGAPVEIEPGRVVEVRATLPGELEAGNYAVKVGTVGGVSTASPFYYRYGGTGGAAPQNWLQDWSYRRKITITEQSGNTLTNYQVRIELSAANFDYSKASSDGSDIRFTDSDGTTPLPYWIERWDPSGTSVIWVKVPEIPASGEKEIYIYYGNPSATSESNLLAVAEPLPASDGAGYRIYHQEWVMPENRFQTIGTPQNRHADDSSWNYPLPFNFPYYDSQYSSVYVHSNGFIALEWNPGGNYYHSSESTFRNRRMIAPFWADLMTISSHDIYISNSYSDEYGSGVYIRWYTTFYYSNGNQNFAVVLYSNGLIRFDYGTIYGSSSTDDTPVIGVSEGDNNHYTISSYNGVRYPSNYNSVMFWPRKAAATEPSVTIGPEEQV